MPQDEIAPRRRDLAGPIVVTISGVAVLALTAWTGGVVSPFLPLLPLPLLIASVTRRFLTILITGMVLACGVLVLPSPDAAGSRPALASLCVVAATVLSAVYAHWSRGASETGSVTPSEREGLLGMAYTDPMTGLFNFRKFRTYLDEELRRAARYGHSLSLILIDLDGFKGINDRYGHPAGDRVLAGAAAVIRATVRETDLPARYGGEEFVVVCPETTADEALRVAERIRIAIEAARYEVVPDERCAVTCSAGVASFPDHAHEEVGLIEAADAALYSAKYHGKNRAESPAKTRTPS